MLRSCFSSKANFGQMISFIILSLQKCLNRIVKHTISVLSYIKGECVCNICDNLKSQLWKLTCSAVVMVVDGSGGVPVSFSMHWKITITMRCNPFCWSFWISEDASEIWWGVYISAPRSP